MMKSEADKYIGTWGQFPYESHLHPEDREKLTLFPYGITLGLIFRCIGQDENYLVLKYGDILIRVEPDSYHPIPQKLNVDVSDWVYVKNDPLKKGVVYEIQWHRNEERPMFFIKVNGTRKSTRRYWEEEIQKIESV